VPFSSMLMTVLEAEVLTPVHLMLVPLMKDLLAQMLMSSMDWQCCNSNKCLNSHYMISQTSFSHWYMLHSIDC